MFDGNHPGTTLLGPRTIIVFRSKRSAATFHADVPTAAGSRQQALHTVFQLLVIAERRFISTLTPGHLTPKRKKTIVHY
jgi:hypothetical protein